MTFTGIRDLLDEVTIRSETWEAYAINPDTEERIRRVGFSGAVIVVQVYAQ